MALTSEASGSAAMSTGTDVTLATISNAGVFELSFDTNPIVNGELLILIVEKKVLTGGTRRIVDRMVVANHAPTCPIVEDKPRTSLFELVYKLRQEGGSNRTIDWQVVKLQ
jgi:hypothetical protein